MRHRIMNALTLKLKFLHEFLHGLLALPAANVARKEYLGLSIVRAIVEAYRKRVKLTE